MYKVKNPYKGSIMSLNMIGVEEYRKASFSFAEATVVVLPAIAAFLAVTAFVMPEMSFLAECQNIPGGDVCSISFK